MSESRPGRGSEEGDIVQGDFEASIQTIWFAGTNLPAPPCKGRYGSLGTVKSIDDEGIATVEFEGREKTVRIIEDTWE